MEVADDISSPKVASAIRHYGNFTEINVTVQVPSIIRVDSMSQLLQGSISGGQVEDGDNASRNNTAVALEMFWLDNPGEKLINGVYTSINGSFNLSVPTDVLSNGTLRGNRELIICCGRFSPFYLTDTSNHPILVQGVYVRECATVEPDYCESWWTGQHYFTIGESSNMFQTLVDIQSMCNLRNRLPSNTTDPKEGRISHIQYHLTNPLV